MATPPMATSDIFSLDPADLSEARERARAVLRDGGVLVGPTDTVYGVLADVSQPDAVERLRSVRAAPSSTPPAVLLHNPRFVPAVAAAVPEAAERLMAAYWPGPLSLILRAKADLEWALGRHRDVIMLRMPAEPFLLQVLYDVGPLACTAAGVAGSPAPGSAEAARASLGDAVDLYVDGGERAREPSTVVDVTRGGVEVLRSGAVSEGDVAEVVSGALDWGVRPGVRRREAEEEQSQES